MYESSVLPHFQVFKCSNFPSSTNFLNIFIYFNIFRRWLVQSRSNGVSCRCIYHCSKFHHSYVVHWNEYNHDGKQKCFHTLIYFQIFSMRVFITFLCASQTWSITYHSWLTFLLLLGAIVLWMVPNQRQSMLRVSPFLIAYAIFLLVTQYAFDLDFINEELNKTHINETKAEQIGFSRSDFPVKELAIKVRYFYVNILRIAVDFWLSSWIR